MCMSTSTSTSLSTFLKRCVYGSQSVRRLALPCPSVCVQATHGRQREPSAHLDSSHLDLSMLSAQI